MADPMPSTWPSMRESEDDEPKALADLLADLPEWISRRQAANVIPGLITAKALANLDHRRRGPWKWRYTGRGLQYETKCFLAWLEEKFL